MAECWKESLEVILCKALFKQAAQDHVYMAFEYLQGQRFHKLSGQSFLQVSNSYLE